MDNDHSMRVLHDTDISDPKDLYSLGVVDLDLSLSQDAFGLRAFDISNPLTRNIIFPKTYVSREYNKTLNMIYNPTRLLGRPQPQMYPPVALNQYTLVNRTHKHYIYMLQGPTNILKSHQSSTICKIWK